MIMLERQRLRDALTACLQVQKSEQGEFSAKWLRDSGTPVLGKTLAELCGLGCLSFRANGMQGQGTRWYRVLRDTVPAGD